jgi:hypothetical protein
MGMGLVDIVLKAFGRTARRKATAGAVGMGSIVNVANHQSSINRQRPDQ